MHAIQTLIQVYIDEFEKIKQQHVDLSDLAFNKSFGLTVIPPASWPLIESVSNIAKSLTGMVTFVYNTTEVYDQLCIKLKDTSKAHNYISWHEVFVAMSRTDVDARLLKAVKLRLAESDFVFFIGASSAITDVVDWVRGGCSSCLVVVG